MIRNSFLSNRFCQKEDFLAPSSPSETSCVNLDLFPSLPATARPACPAVWVFFKGFLSSEVASLEECAAIIFTGYLHTKSRDDDDNVKAPQPLSW